MNITVLGAAGGTGMQVVQQARVDDKHRAFRVSIEGFN
jgi:hypothetical protein